MGPWIVTDLKLSRACLIRWPVLEAYCIVLFPEMVIYTYFIVYLSVVIYTSIFLWDKARLPSEVYCFSVLQC